MDEQRRIRCGGNAAGMAEKIYSYTTVTRNPEAKTLIAIFKPTYMDIYY
jgi:hypothetical protein